MVEIENGYPTRALPRDDPDKSPIVAALRGETSEDDEESDDEPS